MDIKKKKKFLIYLSDFCFSFNFIFFFIIIILNQKKKKYNYYRKILKINTMYININAYKNKIIINKFIFY